MSPPLDQWWFIFFFYPFDICRSSFPFSIKSIIFFINPLRRSISFLFSTFFFYHQLILNFTPFTFFFLFYLFMYKTIVNYLILFHTFRLLNNKNLSMYFPYSQCYVSISLFQKTKKWHMFLFLSDVSAIMGNRTRFVEL